MPNVDIRYEELPSPVRDNLSPDQWRLAQRGVVPEGGTVPETTVYINLKNGQCLQYEQGQHTSAPLLPTHDLSGGRGTDDTQFYTSPPGAHGVP